MLISPSLFVLKDIKNASNFVFSQVNNHLCQHAVSYQINYPFAIWNLLIEKDLCRSNMYLVVGVCVLHVYEDVNAKGGSNISLPPESWD